MKRFEEKFEEVKSKYVVRICPKCNKPEDQQVIQASNPEDGTILLCHVPIFSSHNFFDLHNETTRILLDDLASSIESLQKQVDSITKKK